jgi:hypothetical protein
LTSRGSLSILNVIDLRERASATVSTLVIPKQYERGFAVIRSLSDSDINRILEVLKGASPASRPSDIFPILRPALPALPENDVQTFLDTLYSLYLYRSHSDASIDQFVADLSDAIRESESKEVRTTDPDELSALKSKFKSLLTIRPLSTLSKAHRLRYDSANLFSDAKIISDIRPVWDGNVKEPPQGIVITQTLKLEYSRAGGPGELYLLMDEEGIELLISVLARAKEKAATLKSLASGSWMEILDE